MSETFPSPAQLPAAVEGFPPITQGHEVALQLTQVDISPDQILVPKDQAIAEHGINGNILGVITLPSGKGDPSYDKQIGIIDFGEEAVSQQPAVYINKEGVHKPVLGRATTRYGLVGLNYAPADQMSTLVNLATGESVKIGRNVAERANRKLGIVNNDGGSEDRATSHNHLSITVSPDNQILSILDLSTHGTTVRVADNANSLVDDTQTYDEEQFVDTMPRAQVRALAQLALATPDETPNDIPSPPTPPNYTPDSTPTAEELLEARVAVAPEIAATLPNSAEDKPIAQTEVAPAETEVAEMPNLSEVFTSGDSIQASLDNPLLDPSLKAGLQGVVNAWGEAKHAKLVSETWTETVMPRLRHLAEVTPSYGNNINNMVSYAEELSASLTNLSHAIYDGDKEYAHQLFNRIGLSSAVEELTFDRVESDGILQAAHQLGGAEMESDSNIRRSMNASEQPDSASLDELATLVADVSESNDIAAVMAAVNQSAPEEGGRSWRSRQDAIQEIVSFARVAGNTYDVSSTFVAFRNYVDEFMYDTRNRGLNADAVDYLQVPLTNIRNALDDLKTKARRVQAFREEIR